jgi:hypothetical protein
MSMLETLETEKLLTEAILSTYNTFQSETPSNLFDPAQSRALWGSAYAIDHIWSVMIGKQTKDSLTLYIARVIVYRTKSGPSSWDELEYGSGETKVEALEDVLEAVEMELGKMLQVECRWLMGYIRQV